jgi:lipoate---protein ligase
MQFLDYTFTNPAQDLACDEALLDQAEAHGGEFLRFWEPTVPFVVLGFSNPLRTETFPDACTAAGVPILRRCSGGGTVLQGPGCLNYALILSMEARPELQSVTGTNRFVMTRNAAILQPLLEGQVTVNGFTDLALEGRKFSGNAQRRRRRFVLFHGTFLLEMNPNLMDRLLPIPSRQPAYRQQRSHGEFLSSLPLPRQTLREAFRRGWHATEPSASIPHQQVQQLVNTKYALASWNFKT